MAEKPVLQIIIGSTRPNRVCGAVAQWFIDRARQDGQFDVQVTDLRELDLPMMDEPNHPRLQDYQHEHTKAWSKTIEASDAIVYVMPEYNFTFTAPVKNSLDYLFNEWANKAFGMVNYGGVSGGLRAAQALKPVASALQMVTMPDFVTVPMVAQHIEDGKLNPTDIMNDSADALLNHMASLTVDLMARRKRLAEEADQ
ncbi:NADPH-dependent FMN reductase [Micrococcoides hystricis]|uniref:NADPH-dependent FMN reductase n=1 Tax=Micrococcoides hystricis TaxID=1572761 RepID=A0ABV6PB04_9MICC